MTRLSFVLDNHEYLLYHIISLYHMVILSKKKSKGSSRLCVIIFAYEIVKCLLGKTFRTILLNKLSV
ncbi:hypothetical protein MAESPC_03856 [Microcystis aeruginosa SPC777]|uniref:Uncharacterized protein n=1 Tax=Microcystis aeruginosa SPC777 TaxID=482300 RepID=S3J2Z5_MICAE|nr:hypothetical protein MAESPC_03856 [Microcystis aeruginosa SPC777]